MIGRCSRCGVIGPIDRDHPSGRDHDIPLHPDWTLPLCRACCHKLTGRLDRGAGVEGGAPTVRLVASRVASRLGCYALTDEPLVLDPQVIATFARLVADVARRVPADLAWD